MGKTKEEVKMKKARPAAISAEHLKKVQETVNNMNRSQLEIGSMEVKKHEIMHGIAGLRDELTLLQKDLEKEYGTFDVNIQDGKINYKDNVEANTQD